MTAETALWILGAAVVPLIGWTVFVTIQLGSIKGQVVKLVDMLEHPEKTGFGKVVEDNSKAIRALTHYIQWLAKTQTGVTPPPPIGIER